MAFRKQENPNLFASLSLRALGLVALIAAFVSDQAHKFWMLDIFDIKAKAPITLTPFLDLVLSWNHGVSYSLFPAHETSTRLALLAFQGLVVTVLGVWMWRAQSRLTSAALGLIIGGALGNICDRLFRGAVADFFYFHTELPVGPLANYVFNIADVAITFGVFMLIYEGFSAAPPAPEAE